MNETLGYTLERIKTEDLSAIDLTAEAMHVEACEAYSVILYDDNGPKASAAEMLIVDGCRAGISWGADADWTDCDSPEDAIERYLGIDGKEMLN